MKTYPLVRQNQQSPHPLNQPQPKRQKLQKQQTLSVKETDVALVVGRAPWWMPKVRVLAASTTALESVSASDATPNGFVRNSTFAAALKDFLQNFSFHSYGKLVETGRPYQEKLFWLAFHIVALSALIIFLLNYHDGTGQRLLTTSIYDPSYPIREVPFPAISICSINRISNESALRYAQELNRMDPRNRSVEHFYGQIKHLLFTYYTRGDMPDYDKALKFQRFLDIYDREDNELFFNTRRRMVKLTPSCRNILQHCRLGGNDFDCTRDFTETFTSKGLCCTFNRNRKYFGKRKYRYRFFGPDMGLVLLLNASHKDDFFHAPSTDSFEIFIHSPLIWPDPSSGSVEERIVQTGTDTFLALTPQIVQTVDDVRYLKPKVRNCLYEDEILSQFSNGYTFSNCISYCRARSIVVLCDCLPFMMSTMNLSSSIAYCSLQHRECLMRYDFKWYNVITQRQNIRGLEREMEDSLYCPDCLPTCSEIRHGVTVMDLPLNVYNMKSFPTNEENITDLAMVHIYFGVTHAVYYRRFLSNSWFEKFSFIGNICGIIAGFSLIGIGEVLFFVIQQIYLAFRHEELSEDEKSQNKKEGDQTLIILP